MRADLLLSRIVFLPAGPAFALLLLPTVQDRFFGAGLRWLYVLTLSFLASYLLTPLFKRLAIVLNILDQPGGRKVHAAATPLLGGAAVFAAFLIAILANGMVSGKLIVILAAAAMLFLMGIVDDVRELTARWKMLLQLICTVAVIAAGVVLKVIPESFGTAAWLGNSVLTLLWIVGITNALNFFDGMDGLAAGLGAIIGIFLGITAFQTDQPFLGWVAVAMVGSCSGFLPHNFRVNGSAAIFLGDSGSTFIGFTLACIAVYGDWSDSSPLVAMASPLLIFWVLIFDMVHITVDRFTSGKVVNFHQWLEYTGKDHLHHRLAHVLGSNRRSVLFIYLMSGCLGLSSLLLRNARPIEAAVLLLQAFIVVVLVTVLERRGRSLAPAVAIQSKSASAPSAKK
ncbi:MAG TPA: glycosyltransferase family 4 protein [Desulfobacterales bacterium]